MIKILNMKQIEPFFVLELLLIKNLSSERSVASLAYKYIPYSRLYVMGHQSAKFTKEEHYR